MGTSAAVGTLMAQAALTSPDLAVLGGDIAYANGTKFSAWDEWFDHWMEHMIRPDGRLIPIIAAIGNHEMHLLKSPYFPTLFAQGERTYFRRYLGSDSVLYVLDSGHEAFHWGSQSFWLKQAMREDFFVENKLAVYHIPLYPAHRSPLLPGSILGRKIWGPIFDRNGLDVAFENHDHVHKRTKRLKRNKIVETGGTVYLGDGDWGKSPRSVKPNRWYLESAHAKRHFWKASLRPLSMNFEAIDANGNVFDEIELGF